MAAVSTLFAVSRCLLAVCRSGVSSVQRPLRAAGCLGPGAARLFSSEDKVTVNFVNRDGEAIVAEGKIGESLLDLVVEKNLDIDGFGCGDNLLCCRGRLLETELPVLVRGRWPALLVISSSRIIYFNSWIRLLMRRWICWIWPMDSLTPQGSAAKSASGRS